jgi:protein TonB
VVVLDVKVSAQGRATGVTVAQSSGYPLLDEAALTAVRRWEFDPARKRDAAVDSEILVPVRFRLTD